MHKNRLWLGLLTFILLCFIWFLGGSVIDHYRYNRLNSHTYAKEVHWSMLSKKSDLFFVQARYRYQVDQQEYEGVGTLSSTYRNSWGVEKSIQERREQPLLIWYDSKNPSFSSLQKQFPYKSWLYTAILGGIFIYFIWIGFRVANRIN